MDSITRKALKNLRERIAGKSGFTKNSLSMWDRVNYEKIWEFAKEKKYGLYLELLNRNSKNSQYYVIRTTKEPEEDIINHWMRVPILDLSDYFSDTFIDTSGSWG